MTDYDKKTYSELVREKDRLRSKYEDLESECIKNGLSYSEFCDKAHDISEDLYFIKKYIRLKKDPTVEYGKEWKGDLMTIDKFKLMCQRGLFVDGDGYGYYATESAKSDIEIYPSDVAENMLRTDFTHVIWFNS